MNNFLILLFFLITTAFLVGILSMQLSFHKKLEGLKKTLNLQYNIITKMQITLKEKTDTSTITEHAELIYQDLLQNLIPIMASLDVMPRNTSEHPLWRALGGVMDEYAKTPFLLEKLRRAIKLDSEISRCTTNYINRANSFLTHLSNTDSGNILTSTFTDGLLGQSLTFFTQAQQLAKEE